MYEKSTPEKLQKNLKMLMLRKEINTGKLIRDLGLGQNTFYRWNEYFPNVGMLMNLADYLGVSVDELLIGKEGV